jgi:Protein of unknown function (DUF4197)
MKIRGVWILLMIVGVALSKPIPAKAQWEDMFKKFKESVGLSEELSTDKIIAGLKDALHVGTGNAVEITSRVNGYYNNPEIRIPLPGAVQKVEGVLRTVGYGKQVDAFELSMNRAAEKAVPAAKGIFWDAIKKMSFTDARKILDGGDDAATLYFKDKTYEPLYNMFKPTINDTMGQVGVTRQYQDLEKKVHTVPFTEGLTVDLDDYVTKGALDGLFVMLAAEEKKIREDPAARITPILKEVFGGK